MLDYTPYAWFWQVAGRSDFWSSAAGSYVETLPDDQGFTRITSEDDLTDVLATYGLPGPTVKVPAEVSPAQAEIALYRYTADGTIAVGVLLGQVNALIDGYPYEPVRIWWRKATYIARRHPYLEAVAIEMGLSDEAVDGLFVAAKQV